MNRVKCICVLYAHKFGIHNAAIKVINMNAGQREEKLTLI